MKPTDRIGTLAWNGFRHFEIYYAVSGIGAVCHTINPRLFPEQIAYIVNHAEDGCVFFDLTFLPLVEKLAPQCKGVRDWIAMTDKAHMPRRLADRPEVLRGPGQQPLRPSSSGRRSTRTPPRPCATPRARPAIRRACSTATASTVLHAYGACLPDALNLSARDVVLPVVPMFHVNAWGLPYSAPLVGAKLVFPGAQLDGASLSRALREGERHRLGRRAHGLARPARAREAATSSTSVR